jgi:hypothetical protein
MTPTMNLRFLRKAVPVPGQDNVHHLQPVLQQRFDRPDGTHVWQDVPVLDNEN